MEESYVIYKGAVFTLEWYFDESGKSQAKKYFKNLDKKMQTKAFALFMRIGDFGIIRDITKFRNEGDDIYAFKPQPERFLSFFQKGKKIIVTNAFMKKTDKLPKAEKNRAIASMEDYLIRTKRGEYYGN